jgi:hypothetical protein
MSRGRLALVIVVLLAGAAVTAASGLPGASAGSIEVQSLDGRGNNLARPEFGMAGSRYIRVGDANYADDRGAPVEGPNARFISNRVFNDVNQNIVDDRSISRWGFAWSQFIGLDIDSVGVSGTKQDIVFGNTDPLEAFRNRGNILPFRRSAAAVGTGDNEPREQVNNTSSFLDASSIYGVTSERLEFLRAGPVDGDLGNNSAFLLLPGGQLPRRDARGNAAKAPEMLVDGRLKTNANRAAVAGSPRANQNVAVQGIITLFAREHNRIVAGLPSSLSEQEKFEIARRTVIAEIQFVTYNEFLPALGVQLAPYRGYNTNVNPTLSNEFAVVGFRLESMASGTYDLTTDAARFPERDVAALKKLGVVVEQGGEEGNDRSKVSLQVPFNLGSFNPDLLPELQLGPLLQGLGQKPQAQNDEQIDNQLRSVLFQVPTGSKKDCLDGDDLPTCFDRIADLGALDIERGRDHGIPLYNDLRRAFGLEPKNSFEALTGEDSDAFPSDRALTRGQEINDPDSLDFVELSDRGGRRLRVGSEDAEEETVEGTRRTTLAARLKAIYGSVDKVDAFVGMVSERHVAGTEFGALQLAIWKKQFQALRDGDRFFFGNDPGLGALQKQFGIDFKRNLADIIASNTDVVRGDLGDNVFIVDEGGQRACLTPEEIEAGRVGLDV